MLTEERYALIIKSVNEKHSMKIGELCELLDASEATVRRDLNELAKKHLIVKVHGGAIAVSDGFTQESGVEEKAALNMEEKDAIARYAASLIEDGDYIFMDAGTTTERMIDYLPRKNVTFVTSGFINAKRLAMKGFQVYIPGGRIKPSTEAIVGSECVASLSQYNFTKCFMGVNGISLSAGMSTPDKNEATVKKAAIAHSKEVFFLADHSKFDRISFVTFAGLKQGTIITDELQDQKYKKEANIKEVK